jgi:hypothetical protein
MVMDGSVGHAPGADIYVLPFWALLEENKGSGAGTWSAGQLVPLTHGLVHTYYHLQLVLLTCTTDSCCPLSFVQTKVLTGVASISDAPR